MSVYSDKLHVAYKALKALTLGSDIHNEVVPLTAKSSMQFEIAMDKYTQIYHRFYASCADDWVDWVKYNKKTDMYDYGSTNVKEACAAFLRAAYHN